MITDVDRSVLLRLMVLLVKRIREKQEAFEDVNGVSVRAGDSWEIGAIYLDRGVYSLKTYDPRAARLTGDRDVSVIGEFEYVEPGDITAETVGTLNPRFRIVTDFMHMIEPMAFILDAFEALMGIPPRRSGDDPTRDKPTDLHGGNEDLDPPDPELL